MQNKISKRTGIKGKSAIDMAEEIKNTRIILGTIFKISAMAQNNESVEYKYYKGSIE